MDIRLSEDLKKSILQYALSGKLTNQLDSDSSVDELVKNILKEKELLVKEKNARQDKKYDEITDDEKEFEIPSNWRWLRVSDIGVYKKGPFGSALTKSIFVSKSNNSVKVYEQKNAIQKDWKLGNYYISKKYYEEKMQGFKITPGDIIVSCAGTIGETYVIPDDAEEGIINQALMRMNIVKSINLDFFLYYFDHILKKNAKKESSGSAIKNIPPFDVFKAMLFPLPPIEEQERIVKKLDVILSEIDDYEKYESELNEIMTSFPNEYKKSVVQSAMQGKATKQLEADSSVSEYLEKVDKLRKDKIANKSIFNKKSITKIDDVLFEIPDNWQWVRFGRIVDFKLGKTPERTDSKSWGNDYKWFSIADMKADSHISESSEGISEYGFKHSFNSTLSPKGTLLMSFKLTVGKVSILDVDALHNEAIISIFPFIDEDNVLRDYLFKILPYITKYGDTKSAIKGNTLNSTSLNDLLIPLPPKEEQKRIIEKLNSILPLCNDLEQL